MHHHSVLHVSGGGGVGGVLTRFQWLMLYCMLILFWEQSRGKATSDRQPAKLSHGSCSQIISPSHHRHHRYAQVHTHTHTYTLSHIYAYNVQHNVGTGRMAREKKGRIRQREKELHTYMQSLLQWWG